MNAAGRDDFQSRRSRDFQSNGHPGHGQGGYGGGMGKGGMGGGMGGMGGAQHMANPMQ